MELTRRGFLGAMLAAAAAPAIVKASNLMPIYVPKIITPIAITLWGDGVHNDQQAIAALVSGGLVADSLGRIISQQNGAIHLPVGTYALGGTVKLTKDSIPFIVNGSRFEGMPELSEPLFILDSDAPAQLTNNHFIGSGQATGFVYNNKHRGIHTPSFQRNMFELKNY